MKSILLPLALTFSVTTAGAATLVTPTSASASLTFTPPTPGIGFFPLGNIINNSGLSGAADAGNYTTITHAAASDTTAWTTDDPAPGGGDWFAEGNAPVAIVLGLDGAYTLTDFVFWGYHFGAGNGNEARAFTLDFSTDSGATYGPSVAIENTLGGHAVASAVTLPLGGVFTANTVRVTITDNQAGGGFAGGDRLGLGEVKFLGTVVPEPSVALLGALGALGMLNRRRRA
jgi:hypothetical protein